MANLIQTNNANIKIFGAKVSAGTVSGGGGGNGGGGPTATFWSNWTSLPNYTKVGTANFTVNGNTLEIDDRTGLTTFNSSYTYKGGSIDARNCTNLTTINCYANQLTSIDVSGCVQLNTLACYSNQLTTLSVSGLTNLGRVWAFGNQLTQSSVDQILADMVTNNYSGGGFKQILLYGGSNSAPSAAGLANKAILESNGWWVQTN